TTATVSGPSPSSPSRALFNNPGTASRSARCSSLYQGLNSASLTAGTSAHTIRSPLPFFAVVDSLMHGPFRGRIVDQAAAESQRKAGRARGPLGVVAMVGRRPPRCWCLGGARRQHFCLPPFHLQLSPTPHPPPPIIT